MDRLCPAQQEQKTSRPSPTLGQVLRLFLSSVADALNLGARPRRILQLLAQCGTVQLGLHLFQCTHCHARHSAPRSCGDRHCPRCLAAKSRRWLQDQLASLLPVTYYHCVFTLPQELHPLVLLNPARLYPLLFDCASQTLLEFGRNRLGGDLGLTAVLHTWGQQLNFHPHLHFIVTGGALNSDGLRWRSPKQRKFLFPVKALAALFRGKFLDGLQQLAEVPDSLRWPDASWSDPAARQRSFSALYAQKWVVYAKRPFGGPEQVLRYLAHYTHRVAISNPRILSLDPEGRTVTFTWRDYRHGARVQPMTLSAQEFIRRFCWHILPPRLVRIRHYGILANHRRTRDIARARAILQRRRPHRSEAQTQAQTLPQPAPAPPMLCPHCGRDTLRWIGYVDAHGRTHLHVTVAIWDSS